MPPSYAFLSLTRAKPSIYAPLIVPESFLAPLQEDTPGQRFWHLSSPESAARHAWATLSYHFVARDHCRRPSREQIALFRSRDNLGRPFREQNAPFRSRDHLGRPSREQNAPSRSRDSLGRPSREQIAAFHSRDCRERHTRQPRRFFSELRGLHGNSTGAPRCRRGSTRANGTRNRT